MSTRDVDADLLWEMGKFVSGRQELAFEPSDDKLVAYRDGSLTPEESEIMERKLAAASGPRQQLAKLADIGAQGPDASVRDAMLDAFASSLGSRRPSGRAWKPAQGERGILQAAVLVAVICSPLLFFLDRTPADLPAELTYDVVAEGLVTVRRPPPGEQQVEAFADTPVHITAYPKPQAVQDVEFGLYRYADGRLERLPFGRGVVLEVIRGAAVVTARASELAHAGAEDTLLFLVAARPGDLPAGMTVSRLGARLALQDGERRRAYPLEIRLVEKPSSG